MKRILLALLLIASPAWSAFPVVQARNTSTQSVNTTHTVNLPASIAANDVLTAAIVFSSDPGSTSISGWTAMCGGPFGCFAGNSICFAGTFRKTATGSEGATASMTTANSVFSAHITHRISGADVNGATIVSCASAVGASPSFVESPSLSPTGGAKDYLWIAAGANADEDCRGSAGVPTSYGSGTATAVQNVASWYGISTAERNLNTATENPGVNGCSSSSWRSYTLAVHPAPDSFLRRRIIISDVLDWFLVPRAHAAEAALQ